MTIKCCTCQAEVDEYGIPVADEKIAALQARNVELVEFVDSVSSDVEIHFDVRDTAKALLRRSIR